LRQQCQLLLAKLGKRNQLIDNVRALLLARPGVFLDINGVAEKLGFSVRTFQRKLGEEKTSFQEILDEVRFRLAKEYLRETRIPLQEIAPLLGFNEPGNFTHAFKRWSGVAPNAFRQNEATRLH
jgi:AraC-like DNA-binding protein